MTCLVLSSVCDGGTGSVCGHCTKLQTHAGKPPQAARQRQQLSLCVLFVGCLISVRGQETLSYPVWTCSQPWVKGSVSWPLVGVRGCVMGLATSWMETLMISSRTEHNKLSESAQPAHWHIVLGTWDVIFHLWYVLSSRAGWITQGSLDTRQAKWG